MKKKNFYFLFLYLFPFFLYFLHAYIGRQIFFLPGDDSGVMPLSALWKGPESFSFLISLSLSLLGVFSFAYFKIDKKIFQKPYKLFFYLCFGVLCGVTLFSPYHSSYAFWFICDIYLWLLFSILVGIFLFLKKSAKNIEEEKSFLQKNRFLFLSFLVCSILFFMPYMAKNFLPRYFLYGFPFLFYLIIKYIVSYKSKILSFAFVLAVLSFYAFNLYGDIYYYLAKKINLPCHGGFLEASLKFEEDMEANLLMAKIVEEKYSDKIIVPITPLVAPYSHIFISPRYGYVKKAKKVCTYGRPFFAWKGVPNLDFNKPKLRSDMIFIISLFPPAPGEIVLETIVKGDIKKYIFKRP